MPKSRSNARSSSVQQDQRTAAAQGGFAAGPGAFQSIVFESLDVDALREGFAFGGDVVRDALDAVRNIQTGAFDVVDSANTRSLQLADDALREVGKANDHALDFASGSNRRSLEFADKALSLVEAADRSVAGVTTRALEVAETALDSAFASTPGGGLKISKEVITASAVAAVVIVGAVAFSRAAK